ncbi:NAD-binding protein [Rhodococcus koreensis]|uniref:NAD-binding protein n=1 Tax=Rhodococcus koreensis TaxID=99653 RepID=UPI00366E8332
MADNFFLVIGDTNVARRVTAALTHRHHRVEHLVAPNDDELRAALMDEPRGVAVLAHDDVTALRYALATAHLRDEVPLVVTIFDRTVADQLSILLPQCEVTSPADLAAPTLAGPCIEQGLLAAGRSHHGRTEVRSAGGKLHRTHRPLGGRTRWRTGLSHVTGLLRTPDNGTRMLLAGLVGLNLVLLADVAWLIFGQHHEPIEALQEAVRVVTTVGPAAESGGHPLYGVAASVAMLFTILFTAMFTAGFVDRLLGPRLVGLVGPRVLPRSGHMIVVGLGQVGLRLCRELVALGVPVVGVERDPQAENLRLVRALRIPAVVGHGGDIGLLGKLGAHRARAIAAVGSDDLDNIAVAIAAQGVSPQSRLIIRAGGHQTIAETKSLLRLGVVRDVASLSAVFVVATLLGERPYSVVADDADVYIESLPAKFVRYELHPGLWRQTSVPTAAHPINQ